jgi:hypothetical protein
MISTDQLKLLSFVGRRAEVRRDDDVLERQQLLVGGRLGDENVEPSAGDLARDERLVEGVFVDEAAARDVDDVGGRLHELELIGRDHAGRLGRLRHVDGDEVGLLQQLVERDELHAELLGAGRRDVGVVGDDVDAERLQTRRDERADAAEADDAERLLIELGARVLRALPLPLRQRGVRGGNVAGEAQDVADGQFGGRDDVGCRGVHDHDTGRGRGLDVDVVEPDTGARDDLERRSGLDRLGIDLGRGAHQDGVGIGQGLEQRGTVGTVHLADLEVGAERIDGGG